MSRHLLVVSVGPVQELIAAARKTRDLWYGSWLLSEVARAGAMALRKDGVELIFPHPDGLTIDSKAAVANKLLIILPDGSSPNDAVAAVRLAATEHLLTQWRGALAALSRRPDASGVIDEARAERQVASLLEIQAAWVPLAASAGDYQAQRERVERLLAGRKAVRDFEQPDATGGQPMSALDPSRACVIPEWAFRDSERGVRTRRALGIKGGERLDGVSLLKRHGESRRFISVSRVAADPWVRRARTVDGARLGVLADLAQKLLASQAVERLPSASSDGLSQYRDFPFDLELFYDDGRTDDRLAAEPFKSLARQFFEQVPRFGLGEVPPYYAVLVADGDRMGRLISTLASPQEHAQLSEHLVIFARQASSIVAGHHGALVYAGGDDVLALLPLDTAIACSEALRRAFAAAIESRQADARPWDGSRSPTPTLSVGIAIAHYNEPFSGVLEWARAAERQAKGWRNSLAVAFYPRSGGATPTTVRHTWDEDPATIWSTWIDYHRTGALPEGAAYELRDLLAELRQLSSHDLSGVLAKEARRVLSRKRVRGSEPVADAVVAAISASPGAAPEAIGLGPDGRLGRVVDGLIVARRIADVVALAERGVTRGGEAHS